MAILSTETGATAECVSRALDPAVRGGELVVLAAHRDVSVRRAVASRVDAPMASLISLAHERDVRILEALAVNPASPTSVLQNLARSRHERVRVLASARLAEVRFGSA